MEFEITKHIAISVKNYEKALEFYQNVMGMELLEKDEAEAEMQCGEVIFHIDQGESENTFFDFKVENLESAKQNLVAAGCKVTETSCDQGTSFLAADPFGMKFHFYEERIPKHALELGFFSIPALDIEIAKTFYQAVMRWQFQNRDAHFVYAFSGDKMLGAIETANPQFKPSDQGPLLYFRAKSMKQTLSLVTRNGGTIKEQVAIDDGAKGYTSRVLDPFGNSIGFWAPED